jgi:phosphoribosyl 1,2-cyclic phosphodiesterase
MVELLPLSSGSQGNSLLVRGRGGAFLIDAGLDLDGMLARLQAAGHRPEDLDGIVLSHRHLDHVRGAGPLARRFHIPVLATAKTLMHQKALPRTIEIWPHVAFDVGGHRLLPVQLCHDAPETLGFLIMSEGRRLGVATDLGCPGGGIVQALHDLDVLFLEFNHDPRLVRDGPYSPQLKERVLGHRGHLANEQAADLVRQIATPRLQRLYPAHLSATNNTPALALASAQAALESMHLDRVEVCLALQDAPTASWQA